MCEKEIIDFIQTNELVKIKDGLNHVRVFVIKNGCIGLEVGEAIPKKKDTDKYQEFVWKVVWWISEKEDEIQVIRGKHFKNQCKNVYGEKAVLLREMANKLLEQKK